MGNTRAKCILANIKPEDGEVLCWGCGSMVSHNLKDKLDKIEAEEVPPEELVLIKEALGLTLTPEQSEAKARAMPIDELCKKVPDLIPKLRQQGITNLWEFMLADSALLVRIGFRQQQVPHYKRRCRQLSGVTSIRSIRNGKKQ